MTTAHMNTIEAKEEFADVITRVSHHKERIILTRRGKAVAALIPIEDFESLQTSQNKHDLEEATEALRESREKGTVTLDELLSDME